MESKSISLNNIRKERMNPNSRVDFGTLKIFQQASHIVKGRVQMLQLNQWNQ